MKISDIWPGIAKSSNVTVVRDMTASPVQRVVVQKRKPLAGPRELPATLAECEALDEELSRSSIDLECQLGQARGRAVTQGNYADPSWYHRANAALKHMRRDRQRLLEHMKQLRLAERRAHPAWNERDKLLITALRERVGHQAFHECVEQVDSIIEAEVAR